jgi:phosphoglycolate phosphatase
MLDQTRPYAGMVEVVERLGSAGVRLCVATNKPALFTQPMVEALFPGRFAPIVACGGEVPTKPDPTCIRICLSQHPTISSERTLFVGDSDIDVETARNAGIDALAVTWGFQPRERLVGARWTRDCVDEIVRLVLDGE